MMKSLWLAALLTVLLAFMDISGIPCTLFMNVEILDIEPIYWSLMANFINMGIIATIFFRFLIPEWNLGFRITGFREGLKKYALPGVLVGVITGIAFCIGLYPFDQNPTVLKVVIEGIIYYIGVAIIEELYVRGLMLNLIEKVCAKKKNGTTIAIIISSCVFGLGHIFGVLGQPILVIATKVVWTTAMGLYFGMIYKKTNNLWLPIIMHFFINICALPYCFTTLQGYADISLYIILPVYLFLGWYSLGIMFKWRKDEKKIASSTKPDCCRIKER
ncbi:MAG: CPBP family intramembrane metalloprotease [Clostridiaceae bacterium]|nr:CPBP family intramembrane metalloprotease [Clostridiaceae bacterium]